jgi:hypothetical protein
VDGRKYKFYDASLLDREAHSRLPFCLRVVLECLVRNAEEAGNDGDER